MSNRRRFIQLAGASAGLGAAHAVPAGTPAYAVPPMSVPSLPIEGSRQRFPVHRIYCLGLNYLAHIKESGDQPTPPFYFQKANDMIVENHSAIRYPSLTRNFHHEIELVVAIGKGGTDIAVERALDCVFGYATGLDMTRRDLQAQEVELKLPWEGSKSFEQCAPCTAIAPVARVGHLTQGKIQLRVNDALRQDADLSEMILDVPHAIHFLSTSIALAPGDLIYMGTPSGVGPVVPGDRMVGSIEKLDSLVITVA